MKRDKSIDVLKGLAICLVVLGHVISSVYDPSGYNQNWIFKICYSFHMPLFIFISGWLNGLKDLSQVGGQWLWRKTCRLMLPYFIWTCIKWFIIRPKTGIIDSCLVRPLYWYLINLYLCLCIVFIASRFQKKNIATGVLYILFIVGYVILGNRNLVIKNVVMFFPFYVLGFYAVQNKEKVYLAMQNKVLYVIGLAYPLSMIFYSYKDYGRDVAIIKNVLGIDSADKLIKAALLFYNHYVVAVLGICFVWCFVQLICKKDICRGFQNVMGFLGMYTMQLYILHDFFFVRYFNNAFTNSFISVFASIGITIIISIILQKCRNLNKVFFGS